MILDKIQYKVIYSTYYFERELFIIEIDGRYTMVYKSSGLNGGRKGRIIPFFYLLSGKPRFGDIRKGINTGYIWKEFYLNKRRKTHHKKPETFGKGIELFLLKLEKELSDFNVPKIEQDMKDIGKYAKEFNDIAQKYMKILELKPILKTNWFDWGVLELYINLEKENIKTIYED